MDKLIEDLTLVAKVAVANDKPGIAVVAMRAIDALCDLRRTATDAADWYDADDLASGADDVFGRLRDAINAVDSSVAA
jgi:hypothetical protein